MKQIAKFKAVIKAIPTTWQRTVNWWPSWIWWKNFSKIMFYWAIILSSLMIAVHFSLIGLMAIFSGTVMTQIILNLTITMMPMYLIFYVLVVFGTFAVICDGPIESNTLSNYKKVALKYNPITFYLWTLPRGLFRILPLTNNNNKK